MFELTADNSLDYLRRQGWIGAGPAHVEWLSGGVSNFVLRVTSAERRFVLKQSRPQLRTRDAWFSDLERIYREQEVMQALHPLLPDDLSFRSVTDDSTILATTFTNVAFQNARPALKQVSMTNALYSFGTMHPGAIHTLVTSCFVGI